MKKLIVIGVALLVLGLGAATAQAIRVEIRLGDLVVVGNGGFRPTKLPRDHNAPITIYGGGHVETVSGKLPPILETIEFEWDRHGSVETKGLPFCTTGKLEATIVKQARQKCGDSIVGKGRGKALVAFPEQKPFAVESPITLFNGPRKHGNATVIAHAYTTVPVPTTFIVPIEIEKIRKGNFGYRTKARIPKIAGGAGIPVAGNLTVGKRWTFKGKRYSFVNARCATGRLQARGNFAFKDGTLMRGTFFAPCQVRK
jgi:hypothetical protein